MCVYATSDQRYQMLFVSLRNVQYKPIVSLYGSYWTFILDRQIALINADHDWLLQGCEFSETWISWIQEIVFYTENALISGNFVLYKT